MAAPPRESPRSVAQPLGSRRETAFVHDIENESLSQSKRHIWHLTDDYPYLSFKNEMIGIDMLGRLFRSALAVEVILVAIIVGVTVLSRLQN
jgi:hypothetical protein